MTRGKKVLLRGASVILTLAMLLPVIPGEASAAKTTEIRQELDGLKSENAEIQKQIDAIRSQYNANASEIQDLVNQKNGIDQEIALLHTQIDNLNEQIMAYGQLVADSQDSLDTAQEELDELNRHYKERIQAMEEEGEITYWQVIFKANSFTDLLDRIAMVEEIAASDQRRLAEIQAAADVVSTQQAQMQEERKSLEAATQELAESQEALDARRNESDAILRQLIAKQAEFQALLDESEALQDELMQEIAQKQKELSNAEYEERLAKLALQGQNPPSNATWITPVSGYVISSAFGMRVHPVLGYARMHNGIDMACAAGTPIYATRAGTVTVASYQAGGAGNYVALNHGDGFGSIYMHMTNYVVTAGQKVSAGQLIGYVGSTGISTGPHLHFGVSYAGTYVNPLAYIG